MKGISLYGFFDYNREGRKTERQCQRILSYNKFKEEKERKIET